MVTIFIVFFIALVALVIGLKFLLDGYAEKQANVAVANDLVKKHEHSDLNKYSRLFFNLGLVFTLAFVILAFNHKKYHQLDLLDLGKVEDDFDDIMEIPLTKHLPPPPPKVQLPKIIEIPDEEEIQEEIKVELDVEFNEETIIEDIVFEESPEEKVEEILLFVEDQPEFEGGMAAFYKFVSDNMDYPSQARRMGIEGKVYVQFVVEKDGTVAQVKAVKGIGAGCDEEAERVLRASPKFKPGRQRGRAVSVRMVIPIIFKLSH